MSLKMNLRPKKILELFIVFVIAFWMGIASLLFLIFKILFNGKGILKPKSRTSPPSILTNERWGNHHFITLREQGIKLHYVAKGDKRNPLLLCLHGFPESWFSWRHQLKEFSSHYWVVAVDMRGYGESDKPPHLFNYSIKVISEDIKQLVLELGQSECTIVGHDWGGVIAWNLVEKHPNIFKRHISINGPHQGIFKEVLEDSFTQILMSWYVIFFMVPFLPEVLFSLKDFEVIEKILRGPKNNSEAFPDDVIEAYKYYCGQKGGLTCSLHYYRRAMWDDLTKETKKVNVPTLIIWGTEDEALSKELPKRMAKICEDIQVMMVEGAGHFAHEEEAAHVNTLIWDYLRITE